MKKLFVSLLLMATLVGCATSGSSGYTVERATKVAAVIKSAARSGTVLAYTKDKNSLPYLRAVALAISRFATGADLSPTALQLALAETSIKELKTVEAQVALNTVLSVYEVFWGDLARERATVHEPLKITLAGLESGIIAGIADVNDLRASGAIQ